MSLFAEDTSMPSQGAAKRLLDLYRGEIRAALLGERMNTVESLDRAAEVLETALSQRPRVHVGLLGEAQVGKSSLIN
jgi:ribosome biogenesis GTPase A